MDKKTRLLIIINIVFFSIIAFHHIVIYYFGDDWVVYVALFSTLGISSVMLEDTIRQKSLNIRNIAFIEFGLRIVALCVHILSIRYEFNSYWLIGALTAVFMLTLIVQKLLLNQIKRYKYIELESFNRKKLNDLIEKLYENNSSLMRKQEEKGKNDELKNALQASGKSNIISIILLINLIATEFLYRHYSYFTVIPIAFGIVLVFKFLKFHQIVMVFTDKKKKNKRTSYILENTPFIFAIIILYLTEVFLFLDLGALRVTIWFFASLMFIPIMNRKYLLRQSLQALSQCKYQDGEKT